MSNKNFLQRLFARPSPQGVVSDGSNPGVQVALYGEEAISQLVRSFTKIPDADEVLKQVGITRSRLRALMYDDEIAQSCDTRLDAMLATPLRVEPSESSQGKLIMDVLAPVLQDVVSGAWQARLYGYSVLEAIYYQREDGVIGFKYLGEKPFQWFEPKPDGRLMFFPDNGSGGGMGVEVDQRYKFFLTRARPTYAQPYGEALLSRLYWAWYFRNNGWKFWGKFLERFGTPLIVGKSGDPVKMVNALLLAHSQAVMGIDREDSVDIVGVPTGNSGQAFEMFEAAVIRRIQKVVLGQTLTSGTDGGSGNRALGEVHDAVRMDKRNSDVMLVMPTVQKIVDALCELNGWAKHEVVFADELGLEKGRAARDKDLFAVGVRFEKGYFQDNYDLREEDFTLSSEASIAGLPLAEPQSGGEANPGQTGDANATPNAGIGVQAAQTPPHLFIKRGAGTRFTQQQQLVEDQADAALNQSGLPLDPAQVRRAVFDATSPEDLADRLFALMGDRVSTEQFKETLGRALYAADVLGYVHAEGKV